jgi:hypothetical protein
MDDLQFRSELIHAIRVRGGKTRDGRKVFEFCCPRHDDSSPSAWVGENAWGCHACGFTESLDTLAEELGLARRSRGYTIEDYAAEKSFSVPNLMLWGVETFENEKGWCCVRIPYQDTDGSLLRNKFRGEADENGKHRTGVLFALQRSICQGCGRTTSCIVTDSSEGEYEPGRICLRCIAELLAQPQKKSPESHFEMRNGGTIQETLDRARDDIAEAYRNNPYGGEE